MKGFHHFLLTEGLNDYLPQFFEFLKKQPDDVLVHFTNFFRVGLNPKPNHQDPIGVYTFPKKYIMSADFKKNSHFFSMTYAFILKPKGGQVLNLSTISLPEVEMIVKRMGLSISDTSGSGHHSVQQGQASKPGHILWDTMEKALMTVSRSQKNVRWNTLFKKAGVDILVDDGDSIIHSNEPFQVVFLTPGTYQEITYFQHSPGSIYRSTAIRVMKELSVKIFDDAKYTMSVRAKSGYDTEVIIYMNGTYKKNPIQIWGTYYKGKKLDQTLSMKINFGSYLGKWTSFHVGDDTNRVEVHFDPKEPDIEQQVEKIAKVFKSKMNEPEFFRTDKSQYTEALVKEIMKILGLKGAVEKEHNRESCNFKKSLKGFGVLNIYVNYSTNEYEKDEIPSYHLGMSLKPEKTNSYHRPPDLFGSDKAIISSHYVEEGDINFAARKLIHKTLNYWKEMQERLYPTDYDKYPANDWNSHEKIKNGNLWKKLFSWIEDRLNN